MVEKASYDVVLDFWYKELTPEDHFKKDPDIDALIKERFGKLLQACAQGELHHWRHSPEGAVAEIILLDQITRNIYRDSPLMFSNDALALSIAQLAIQLGYMDKLSEPMRQQVLLPFMHSESLKLHDEALALYRQYKLDDTWEVKHRDIIVKFGRYPHRNEMLGRMSSPEEHAFLKESGSSF